MENFCNHWDSGRRDEWIPHVKHVKYLFSKGSQNKDQVEATMVQGLTDDFISSLDKISKAGEYDDGPIYDDLKVLIEEYEK